MAVQRQKLIKDGEAEEEDCGSKAEDWTSDSMMPHWHFDYFMLLLLLQLKSLDFKPQKKNKNIKIRRNKEKDIYEKKIKEKGNELKENFGPASHNEGRQI